jgi:hypothetical protein
VDELHDEVRPAAASAAERRFRRGAGVEDARDIDVVHQRQSLSLGLEAGDYLPAVHARLDDLERDLALDRAGLLRHEDHAHAALADLLEQLVGADDRARHFADRLVNGGDAGRVRFQKAA